MLMCRIFVGILCISFGVRFSGLGSSVGLFLGLEFSGFSCVVRWLCVWCVLISDIVVWIVCSSVRFGLVEIVGVVVGVVVGVFFGVGVFGVVGVLMLRLWKICL